MRTFLTALAITVGLLVVPQAAHAKTWDTTCHLTPIPGTIKSSAQTYRAADTWIYGDSITVQTRASMNLPWSAVDARSGRTTREAIRALKADLRRYAAPDYLVMLVGTNDRYQAKEFRAQVRRVETLAHRAGAVVYWMNIAASTGATGGPLNDYLASRPTVRVLDWAGAVQPGYLADAVHVTPAGCVARNKLITDALR